MYLQTYRKQAKQKLAHIEDVARKVDCILMAKLGLTKAQLITHEERKLSDAEIEQLESSIQQLANHTPLQYITGQQEFMKLPFDVNEHVLIPQPDTELLVETIIQQYANQEVHLLDLCTGSGCIAVSLAYYLPKAHIVASDKSKEALEVAQYNAKNLQVADRIRFYVADLWEGLPNETWDVIVSNPPYIETKTIETLSPEVQQEPKMALDGGIDGLMFYRNILPVAPQHLTPNGSLYLEIGYQQKEAVEKIAKQTLAYKHIQCKKDLAGHERMLQCRKE